MNIRIWLDRMHSFGLNSLKIFILIFLPLAATMSEIFGIGIFLPVFQFIRLDGDLNALVEDSNLWNYVIDGFFFLNIEPSLAPLLMLAFGLFVCRQLLNYIRLVYTIIVTQNLVRIQRNRIFNLYLKSDTEYHDKTPVGNFVNIIVQEVNVAVSGLMAPLELITYIIMLVGYLAVLSFLSLEMTLFALIALVISSFMPKAWVMRSKVVGRMVVNANTEMSRFLVGRLRSPRLVRLSGNESAEKNEFSKLTLSQCGNTIQGSVLKSKTDSVIEPIIIGLSLVFLYFAYSVLHLQIEVIGLYLVVLMRLMPVSKSILMKIQSIQSSMGSIEILEEHSNEMKTSMEKDVGLEVLNKIDHPIVLNNVSYCYQGEKKNALNGVNLSILKHKTTAIVGPSGSGKSTLIDLLPRLRRPNKGDISINGINIEKYRLKDLRKLISYTPQSPQIFDGTIKDHILYGKNDATEDEIKKALHLSGSERFVEKLPKGINTVLGEDAIKLSGGERQRLDLARSLVGESDVLILDEPTSNLDVESEDIFNAVLSKIQSETNTTIVIISHRLLSIVNADQIVVLNNGIIESVGTHVQLLTQSDWYAKAWRTQGKNNN